MEDYPHNSFNVHVRRVANARAYEKPIERIRHEIKLNGDTDYLRLLVVAADMFLSYQPFDLPERGPEPTELSGEFIAR